MNNPQAENGHVDIANEVMEKLMRYHLSGNEWQVLLCVLRKTWGWHKKEDAISLSQFQKFTGLSRPSVADAIAKLVAKRVLSLNKERYINIYSFNKLYTEWDSTQKSTNTRLVKKAAPTSTQKSTTLVPKRVPEMVPKRVPTKENKENNTKENITKVILPNGSGPINILKVKKGKDPEVQYIIDVYQKTLGFFPTDKKPRNMAFHLRNATKKMIKNLEGTAYNSSYEQTIDKIFTWYMNAYENTPGETVNVVYRKVKNLLIPAILKKYDKQSRISL